MTVGLLSFGLIAGPGGKSVLNGFQPPDFPFKNLLLTASMSVSPGGLVDSNGFITSNSFTSAGLVVRLPSNYFGRYRCKWLGNMRLDAGGYPVTTYANSANFAGGKFTGTLPTSNDYVEFDFSAAITGAANNGSGAIRITTVGAFGNVVTPTRCRIANVGGVPNATGDWTFTKIDANNADLIGSTFAGSYTSGGTINFAPASANMAFSNAVAFTSFTQLILCMATGAHANDLADILTGDITKMFNADFISSYSAIRPGIIRLLDSSGINNATHTRSSYVVPTGYITYGQQAFLPNLWCGGNGTSGLINSSGGGITYTCSAATDTPGAWTDGEIFQGILDAVPVTTAITGASSGTGGIIRLQVSSTASFSNGQRVAVQPYNNAGGYTAGNGQGIWTITVVNGTQLELTSNKAGLPSIFVNAWTSGGSISAATVNCGSRGAKLLACIQGFAPTFGGQSFATTFKVTCIYNATLDAVLIASSGGQDTGLTSAWPLAVRVALCNKLNAHYWHQFPHLYDEVSVSAEASYISANLNGASKGYFEYSNEVWNAGFQQTSLMYVLGGCYSASNSTVFGGADYVALKHRRFMAAVATAWGGRGGLNRVLPWQAADGASAGTVNQLYNGSHLNGTTYPLYAAAGFPNYDTAPNRPADYTESFSYAPYYQGAVISSGGLFGTLNALDLAGMTTAADNYATGTAPNIAAAYAWTDNDIRQGTTSTQAVASVTGGNTFNITAHGFTNTSKMAFSLASGGAFYSAGASIGTLYYVVNTTANTFQLSLTQGGAAITGITGGSGVQIGLLGSQTMLWVKTFYYPGFQTAAASYAPVKSIVNYEDAYQGGPGITTAQCTSYGISTTYGGTSNSVFVQGGLVYNMLLGYKNSATFKANVLEHWADQQAVSPTITPSWYVSSGASATTLPADTGTLAANYPWAMLETDLYGSQQFFKSFDAMQQFNQ